MLLLKEKEERDHNRKESQRKVFKGHGQGRINLPGNAGSWFLQSIASAIYLEM